MIPKRKQRVAELVKVKISYIIQRDISPKLPAMATVMHVDMSDDLQHARIFISFYGADEDKQKSLNILKRELKKIRRQLGGTLKLRHLPFLTLIADSSLDHAFKIEELLNKIKNDNER